MIISLVACKNEENVSDDTNDIQYSPAEEEMIRNISNEITYSELLNDYKNALEVLFQVHLLRRS